MTSTLRKVGWLLRRNRNLIAGLWRESRGRPGYVVQPGWIIACPHGCATLNDWRFNFDPILTDWGGFIGLEELTDRLVMAYPDCVFHEALPEDCETCETLTEVA